MARRAAAQPAADPVEFAEDGEGRAVALFDALGTQWKWVGAGMAGAFRTGLDYAAIAPTAAAFGVALDRRVMLDLQELEAESLKAWAEARK